MDSGRKNTNSGKVKMTFRMMGDLLSILTNMFLIGFLVMLSMFHGDTKAFVLIAGMFLWYVGLTSPGSIQSLFTKDVDMSQPIGRDKCNPIILGWWDTVPNPAVSTTTSMLGMIVSYIISPMVNSPWRNENISIISSLVVLILITIMARYKTPGGEGCEELSSLIAGLVLGILAGIAWVLVVSLFYPQGLYHGYFSNSAVCAVKSKTFKCKRRGV